MRHQHAGFIRFLFVNMQIHRVTITCTIGRSLRLDICQQVAFFGRIGLAPQAVN